MIEGLVTGQMWKPSGPMRGYVFVNGRLLVGTLQPPEQVNGDHFLIGKKWQGRILAPPLILQPGMLIVNVANPKKQLNELDFWIHTLNSTTVGGFVLLPMICIYRKGVEFPS